MHGHVQDGYDLIDRWIDAFRVTLDGDGKHHWRSSDEDCAWLRHMLPRSFLADF